MHAIAELRKTTLSDVLEYVGIIIEDVFEDLRPSRASSEDLFAAARLVQAREAFETLHASPSAVERNTFLTALDEDEVETLESIYSEFLEQLDDMARPVPPQPEMTHAERVARYGD